MLEIKQLTRLQIIKYCEKLEKENRNLKEKVEQMQENYENLNDAYTEIL
jgi:HPt (histidine-containing phosphotransfer) domain-containing protein